MKIAIATDHNGVDLKKEIIKYLKLKNYEVMDESEHNSQTDDYPLYAFKVGELISTGAAQRGVLICGTGIGMSIAANKVKGVRCAHVSNNNDAILSRQHNDANIIAMGCKNTINDVIKMVDLFLNTEFKDEERHQRRIQIISNYESD